MPNWKSLDKTVALAGGCVAWIAGAGTAGIAIGAAVGAAALIGIFGENRQPHGPESQSVLRGVREKVLAELKKELPSDEATDALLEGIDFTLGELLPECTVSRARLVDAFKHEEGFAAGAAELVLSELARLDDMFSPDGERAEPLARRFASVAMKAAFEAALDDREYFARLQPYLLTSLVENVASVRAAQERHSDSLARIEALLTEISADKTVALAALRTIASAFEALSPDATPEEIASFVRREADRLREVEARLKILESEAEGVTGQNNRLVPPLRDARDALERGDIAQAEALIAEALSVYAEIRQSRLAQLEETSHQMAEAYALQAEAARIRLDYWAAVRAYDEAAKLVSGDEAKIYRIQALTTLEDFGAEFGDDAALSAAIERQTQLLAEIDRNSQEDEWAIANSNLGAILLNRGKWRSDPNIINEAISALEESAKVEIKDLILRAKIQDSLGSALNVLGDVQRSEVPLKRAELAYRSSLSNLKESGNEELAVGVRTNLSSCLSLLGVIERDVAKLLEAVDISGDNITADLRASRPETWASAQNNQGNAMGMLYELTRDPKYLWKAIFRFRRALVEMSRERQPMEWAGTQYNLANVFRLLGEATTNEKWLRKAISTYDVSLTEWAPERAPLKWAGAVLNRSLAVVQLSILTGDAAGLDAARASAEEAADIVLAARHPPLLQRVARVRQLFQLVEHGLASG